MRPDSWEFSPQQWCAPFSGDGSDCHLSSELCEEAERLRGRRHNVPVHVQHARRDRDELLRMSRVREVPATQKHEQ